MTRTLVEHGVQLVEPDDAERQGLVEGDRERVREVVREHVYPADRAFLEALRGDYLAATREDPGLWSAPNGEQLYRTAIRSWTTLDLDPEEVHRIGLDDLESIELERREISRGAGYGDDTAAYRAALDADPTNTPRTKDELVVRAHEDIDRAMELGYRHPVGPLRTTDIVGLDVRLGIAEELHATLGDRFAPPELLRRMVADGLLGRKSGRGFYEWSEG